MTSTEAARESGQRERAGPSGSPMAPNGATASVDTAVRGRPGSGPTALGVMRQNPDAELRPGPRFPGGERAAGVRGPRATEITTARATAAVGLTVNAAVSGGILSSQQVSSAMPAAGVVPQQGPPYPRVRELVQAVERGYLEIAGVSQETASGALRTRNVEALRLRRSQSVLVLPRSVAERVSARPPRSSRE